MFWLTHKTGFGAGNRGPRVEYITQATDETNTATYTFSGVSIGTPASDRVIVVGVVARPVSPGARTVNLVSVGGINASGGSQQDSGSRTVGAVMYAEVPTGATADIVVTLSGAMDVCGIMVWAVYNTPAAPFTGNQDLDLSDPLTATAVIGSKGGAVFGIAAGDCAGWTWTNLTENYDGNLYASGSDKMSAASRVFSYDEPNFTVTADPADSLIAGVLLVRTLNA